MMMFLFVFFPKMTMTQININLLLTLLMICFITSVYPFEEYNMNKQEIFNELCVLTSSYFMILYTEFIGDYEMKYMIGWFQIGLIAFNIFGNMSVMVAMSVNNIKLKIKKRRNKKAY